jgi:tRNA pseudouridine38/39 synthase
MEEPNLDKNKTSRRKNNDNIDFSKMDKNELICEVERLDKHVKQLKVLLDKATSIEKFNPKNSKAERKFDFSKYNKRHVLLKLAYLGWNYQVNK